MEKNPIAVINQERKEVMLPFPLMKELIDYVQESGLSSDNSFSEYVSEETEDRAVGQAIPLPEKFFPLVADHPGTYFLVYYEDRDNDYYKKGTRFKEVGISTSEYRKTGNKRLREIHIKQPSSSEGLGNVLRVEIEERVNEKGFTTLNTAIGEQVNLPHGMASIEYEVSPDGVKRELAFRSDRLDEGLFEWGGEQKHVRWLRELDVEKGGDIQMIFYRDTYLVGLKPEGGSGERAEVRFTINGNLNDPQSVLVEIGFGPESKAEVLFEDKDKKIKIVLHDFAGVSREKVLNILKQNPNYAFMFKDSVDTEELMSSLTSMVSMLQNDWDKPQAVFTQPASIEHARA